jgi:Ca-activated chloride channel family protein
MLQYFTYTRLNNVGDHPLAVAVEMDACPWNTAHRLARVRVEAPVFAMSSRAPVNLVFLVDVSGSMQPENRLPLVQRSLRLLLDQLTTDSETRGYDTLGIVTYAGEAKVALEPVAMHEQERIRSVINGLKASGSTHGSDGIHRAYEMARANFKTNGINRVILCSDGDFNVGITDRQGLLRLIEEQARSGVFLTVLGYGVANYQDGTAELLANRGNGNYAYIDSFREAQKVLSRELQGSLVTVAKDVKLQIEFNPNKVASWRLLGYENRLLADRDFNDDTKDAGEIGAGHQVTALYEIIPVGGSGPGVDPLRYATPPPISEPNPPRVASQTENPESMNEWMFVKLRYKMPTESTSQLFTKAVNEEGLSGRPSAEQGDYRFASAVAGFGLMLRGSAYAGDLTYTKILELAESGLGRDEEGYRAEFIDLVRKAQQLDPRRR